MKKLHLNLVFKGVDLKWGVTTIRGTFEVRVSKLIRLWFSDNGVVIAGGKRGILMEIFIY